MDHYEVDTVVVGAGVVGLACAAALAQDGRDVLVLEKESVFGSLTSARNSEVIHAGIYYPTGSLKHRMCVDGRRKLYAYLSERNLPHRKCEKLIVATSEAEIAKIESIFKMAVNNGVENVEMIDAAAAVRLEPALKCVAALNSRETGIIDSHHYMMALIADIESGGGSVVYNTPAVAAHIRDDGKFDIVTGGAEPLRLTANTLINSAGLYAHRFAAAIEGLESKALPPFHLAKGSYFSYSGKPVFSRLIYPAPVDGGLGVHVTLDLGGRMKFGPDVEWLNFADPDQVDYRVDIARSQKFYAAIRTYWPQLPDGALQPDYSGCRPKLSWSGEPAADFSVDGPQSHGVPNLVNLFGIESPGLTSSLAIADLVREKLAA